MQQVARLGDKSDHGGTIISASATYVAAGPRGAITGDLHSCPIRGHGVTSLSSDSIVKSKGQPVIRIGDKAGCGAAIITGAPNVRAD